MTAPRPAPYLVSDWHDSDTGARGWFVIDRLVGGISPEVRIIIPVTLRLYITVKIAFCEQIICSDRH